MTDMLLGKASMNIGMKDFMQEFRNNLNNIQDGSEGVKVGKIPDAANFNTPIDQELADDLKVLTQNVGGVSGVNQAESGLSADNTVKGFDQTLKTYLNEVSNAEHNADKAAEVFAAGGNIDVHSVMIAAEKANLSMQLTMQMRNKILQAYQEVSRMQV